MTNKVTNPTLDDVIILVKKGVNGKQIGIELGIKNIHFFLIKNGTTIKKLKAEHLDKPQAKAWVTRKKQALIKAYNKAQTGGIKASINKQFKKQFGTNLKELLAEPKPVKVRKERVKTTKESFAQKEVELLIPTRVRELFEAQNRRIEALEQIIMNR